MVRRFALVSESLPGEPRVNYPDMNLQKNSLRDSGARIAVLISRHSESAMSMKTLVLALLIANLTNVACLIGYF
jgi:hypothetical protein